MNDNEQESIEPLKYQIRNWNKMTARCLPDTNSDRNEPEAIEQLISSLHEQIKELTKLLEAFGFGRNGLRARQENK